LAPVARPEEIPGLVDQHGVLAATVGSLIRNIAKGLATTESIRREFDRQVARVVESGIVPTHLDAHKHVHAIPRVLDAALAVARTYGIRWIRNPFERGAPWAAVDRHLSKEDRALYLRQRLKVWATTILRARFLKRVREAGLETPNEFVGVALTGLWTEAALDETIARTPSGLTEWMVHPGDCDAELRGRRTRLRDQRERERDLLTSPRIRERIESRGILLTPYGRDHG
jgi:predicted glycoside hydrolase/deacetylase ChbG (UPF0249 family)